MNTPQQSKDLHSGPFDDEQDSDQRKSAASGSAAVMQWPKKNLRKTAGTLAAELLARKQAVVLRVLAGFSGEPTLQGGLMAAADLLQQCFSAVRVSIGLCERERISVAAISQQAEVAGCTAESELISAVMQEALDKDQIVVTSAPTLAGTGMQAHRLLCAGRPDRQVVTVPMCAHGEFIAVLCLERDTRSAMAPPTVRLIQQIADLLAAAIESRIVAERGLFRHLKDALIQSLQIVPAARYIKFKAAGALLLCGLLLGYSWQTTYWVKATAELIPLERRVISSPVDGYVQSVETGAGEHVTAGDVLLRMDTSDALLQKARWQSELDGLGTHLRAAMALEDRRQMVMIAADMDKTKANLALVEARLQRSSVVAPVDGVVVSADFSQILGAPVSRGQALLELAPEAGYEVQLMVDGQQINRVHTGARATMKLQSALSQTLQLVVQRIHPIAIAEDGANRFRVSARTLGEVPPLLPGQTGIARIDIGQASLLEIWTEDFLTWLKLKKWEWIG